MNNPVVMQDPSSEPSIYQLLIQSSDYLPMRRCGREVVVVIDNLGVEVGSRDAAGVVGHHPQWDIFNFIDFLCTKIRIIIPSHHNIISVPICTVYSGSAKKISIVE